MAEAIAAISVVVVAVAFVWAVGVGPFGDDGQSVKSVESLVAAKEGGSSASCRWLGQGEAYGELQNVYRCQVRGSRDQPVRPSLLLDPAGQGDKDHQAEGRIRLLGTSPRRDAFGVLVILARALN